MRPARSSVLALLATLVAIVVAVPAGAQGRWRAEYPAPETPLYKELRERLRGSAILDEVVVPLNEVIPIPRDVVVELAECGASRVVYRQEAPAVTLCYEFFVTLLNTVATADGSFDEATFGHAFAFVMLHAVSHAFIAELGLPVPSPSEADVDELVAVTLAATLGAERAEPGMIRAIRRLARAGLDWETPETGAATFDEARWRRFACLIYGADPLTFAFVRSELGDDADGCKARFNEVNARWTEWLIAAGVSL